MFKLSDQKTLKRMVEAFRKGLADENSEELWDDKTSSTVQTLYEGVQSCVQDELYLQEFLQFGCMYKVAGEHGVHRRRNSVPIEKVMQEHIVLRDVFWEFRRARADKEHDFAVEKRVLQCFNNLLQATVLAYQTREPTSDVLDPLRDELTGVFNSLYFMTRLDEEVKRSERYLRDVTVVLLHVDSSKEAHAPDDNELMRAVARVLRRNTRASDILARVECEKFAILMPETRAEDAGRAGERFKKQIVDYLRSFGEDYAKVNIEMGLAAYPEHGDDSVVLMQEAVESVIREGLEGA